MKFKYADRMEKLKPSIIRELLGKVKQDGMISFAGGLPASELFPYEELETLSSLVIKEQGKDALQYDSTQGYLELRQWIADRANNKQETEFDADNVIITQGGQQAIDFVSRIFLNEGDIVLVEEASFLSAYNCFRAYGAEIVSVPMESDGMSVKKLKNIIQEYSNIKLMYIIPDFQNPTTSVWSNEKREKVVEIANENNIMIMEDNPYVELNYSEKWHPSMSKYDKKGNVISVGSFSKILCPGLRIGWAAGNKEVISKLVLAKQSADLQSNSYAQRLINMYLYKENIDNHINAICSCYQKRRDAMVNAIEEYLPKVVKYSIPQGGLFLWMSIEAPIDIDSLFDKCLENNVAFIPGKYFYVDENSSSTMRLNFSCMPEERIVTGIKRIAKAMNEELQKKAMQ